MRKPLTAVILVASLLASTQFATADEDFSSKKLVISKTITGAIAPKSVLASNQGLVSAHNMMYRHSVTIYDADSLELKATVADSVDLSKYGYSKYSGDFKGRRSKVLSHLMANTFISQIMRCTEKALTKKAMTPVHQLQVSIPAFCQESI